MNDKVQNIPVFMVTNTDMVGYTATTMVSIVENSIHNISFYIMDCGLSDFDKKQLMKLEDTFKNISAIKFSAVDMDRFKGLAVWYYGLLDAWAMLLFPESFPEVDKVVHVESDTIVIDDIAKLYNEDLGNYTVAACPDIACIERDEIDVDCSKHTYFNLGSIVINCKKWREENITERCIELGRKYGEKFRCLHQDALNILFSDNNYKILPNRYNLGERKNYIRKVHPEYDDKYFKEEWKHPVIIHFSPNKPWRTSTSFYTLNTVKYFEEWWNYASLTPYYHGLQNAFIAQRIKDEVKGLRLGFDNYGNSLMDTLPDGHPFKGIVGEGKIIVGDKLIDFENPDEEGTECRIISIRYKIFGLVPILKIKISGSGSRRYLLFDHLPLLKVQKRDNGNTTTYKILGFLPIMKIKK